ncbi:MULTISPECIES: transglutaminase domain-containing protein [unclassified Isoptericola]|uniref:transglutaminase domain-containing protein n=1 Tax=unclassified Isoptericola TaxID=2623355 RepID=UPI00365CC030
MDTTAQPDEKHDAPAAAGRAAPTLADYARQSAYSDPGPHADLLRAVAPDPAATAAAACATIVHYRAGNPDLSDDQRDDVDRRWLSTILDAAAARQPGPLDAAREASRQVAGCCRDHTLFSLGVLREHGVPARSRIGFAGYFEPPFFHDHVVVEHWDAGADGGAGRWVRWDPELTSDGPWGFDPRDMPTGPASPFPTAAEVWRAIRAGEVDAASYGVSPDVPELGGKDFVRGYVLLELAHRMREEVLLWDVWGALPPHPGLTALAAASPPGYVPAVPLSDDAWDAVTDALAALLVAADAGDTAAEGALAERYASGLGPRGRVATLSPSGRVGVTDLRERTTRWDAAG